jgi:hypothetical protein
MTCLNKTLAALGMVLLFAFGAFAVSLAYDSASIGSLYALELNHLPTTSPAQLYSRVLTMALQFESSDVPEATRPCSESCPFRQVDSSESLTPLNSAQIHVAKVSLQILQSALLL